VKEFWVKVTEPPMAIREIMVIALNKKDAIKIAKLFVRSKKAKFTTRRVSK